MKNLDIRKFMQAVIAALLLFFLIGIIALCIRSCGKVQKARDTLVFASEFVQKHPFLPPAVPEMPDDYYLVRERNHQWSDEELSRWFTPPDGDLLKELHTANERMISEILGAAP